MANDRATPKFLWLNGTLVSWESATVHASALGWSTIAAVFEGIKAYGSSNDRQLNVWQLVEHYRRFAQSMKVERMRSPWSPEELVEATLELIRANDYHADTYIHPLAYFGEEAFYGAQLDTPTHVRIIAQPAQSRLGSGKLVTACVSSWARLSDNQLSPRVKCVSNYQNSRLAAVEARLNGFDQPILLNTQGKVTEGGASCLFIVRNGVAITPSLTSGILESITRDMILRFCRETLEIPVQEREVERTELYLADEVFFCGTGAEVMPVSAVDHYPVGNGEIGPVTARIEGLFHRVVRGQVPRYREWLTPVYATVAARP